MNRNYEQEEGEGLEAIEFELSDKELAERITKRGKLWRKDHSQLIEAARKNREWWAGNQVDESEILEGEEYTVVNKIFQSIETIVPIVTRRTPIPNVSIRPLDKGALRLQEKISRKLIDAWKIDLDMQPRLEEGVRVLACAKYVAFKYYYDDDEDEIAIKLVPTASLLFPHSASNEKELPAVIERVVTTLGELKARFPEKVDEIDAASTTSAHDDTEVIYDEYWESDFYACLWKNILLHKERNPHFNYEPFQVKEGAKKSKVAPTYNLYKSPRIPYIFLNWFSFGDSLVDDTCLIEQVIGLQKNINKRKGQFSQNADLANGKMIFAGNKISKEDADNVSNDPKDKIYLTHADTVTGAIGIEYGRGLDPSVYNDMGDSKAEVDNIMGTHATTRGEREAKETATGRAMLKGSDVNRLEILPRRIEKLSQKLYAAYIQMMYVYYDEPRPIQIHKAEGDSMELSSMEEDSYISRDELVGKRITVLVEEGSTTPQDKSTMKAQSVDLWGQGGISTLDMLRDLEYGDAEQRARNAFIEKNAPQLLYGSPQGDAYDVDAIRNIEIILSGEMPEVFKTDDVERFTNYISTFKEYIRGTEVDSDLPDVDTLSYQNKANLNAHVALELEIIKQLLEEVAEENPVAEPLQPPTAEGAPIEPVPGVPNPSMIVPTETLV